MSYTWEGRTWLHSQENAEYPQICSMITARRVLTKQPHTPLAAHARGEREISHLPYFKDEERGRWALGSSCLAEEPTAVGFLYWKG